MNVKWHYVNNLMKWTYLIYLWPQVWFFVVTVIVHVVCNTSVVSISLFSSLLCTSQFFTFLQFSIYPYYPGKGSFMFSYLTALKDIFIFSVPYYNYVPSSRVFCLHFIFLCQFIHYYTLHITFSFGILSS